MDVDERIARGFVHAERTRRAAAPGAEVLEVDGLALLFANVPEPTVNGVLVEREPSDPAAALLEAEETFRSRGLDMGIDLQVARHPSMDAAVREAGLTLLFSRPGMAVPITDLPSPGLPAGVEIRRVTSDAEALVLAGVDATAFQSDPAVSERFHAPGWDVDGTSRLGAWMGREPVAGAAGYVHDGAVGVFGVAVLERARRQGLGAAMTVATIRMFPEADMAWLHPSDMARSMYTSLGFRVVSEWEVWVRSSAGSLLM